MKITKYNVQPGDITFTVNAELNIVMFSEIVNAPDGYFEKLHPVPLDPEMFGVKDGEQFPIYRTITDDVRWALRLENNKFYFVAITEQGGFCKVCAVQYFHHLQHLVRDVGGNEELLVDQLKAYWS